MLKLLHFLFPVRRSLLLFVLLAFAATVIFLALQRRASIPAELQPINQTTIPRR